VQGVLDRLRFQRCQPRLTFPHGPSSAKRTSSGVPARPQVSLRPDAVGEWDQLALAWMRPTTRRQIAQASAGVVTIVRFGANADQGSKV
jgi:hypothetical protein